MNDEEMQRLLALDDALEGRRAKGPRITGIIITGALLAVLIWTVVYRWPWPVALVCLLGLALVGLAALRRRPPVAPVELTAGERDRVRRVLGEHGVRPAIALVRALYPEESAAAAIATVRLIAGGTGGRRRP